MVLLYLLCTFQCYHPTLNHAHPPFKTNFQVIFLKLCMMLRNSITMYCPHSITNHPIAKLRARNIWCGRTSAYWIGGPVGWNSTRRDTLFTDAGCTMHAVLIEWDESLVHIPEMSDICHIQLTCSQSLWLDVTCWKWPFVFPDTYQNSRALSKFLCKQ